METLSYFFHLLFSWQKIYITNGKKSPGGATKVTKKLYQQIYPEEVKPKLRTESKLAPKIFLLLSL